MHEQKFKDLISSTWQVSVERRVLDLESEVKRSPGSIPTRGNIFHWIFLFSRRKVSAANIGIIAILVHFEKSSTGRQEVSRCCTRGEYDETIACRRCSIKLGNSPWIWNLGQTSCGVQNKGISGPRKGLTFSKKILMASNQRTRIYSSRMLVWPYLGIRSAQPRLDADSQSCIRCSNNPPNQSKAKQEKKIFLRNPHLIHRVHCSDASIGIW